MSQKDIYNLKFGNESEHYWQMHLWVETDFVIQTAVDHAALAKNANICTRALCSMLKQKQNLVPGLKVCKEY